MPDPYNPRAWYWSVNSDPAVRVFSSAMEAYVAIDDPTYQAFLSRGNAATRISNEAELGEVLAAHGIRPNLAGMLDGYLGRQADELLAHPLFKLVFQHENRLRAIERALGLNGSPANLTAGQARSVVKQEIA